MARLGTKHTYIAVRDKVRGTVISQMIMAARGWLREGERRTTPSSRQPASQPARESVNLSVGTVLRSTDVAMVTTCTRKSKQASSPHC